MTPKERVYTFAFIWCTVHCFGNNILLVYTLALIMCTQSGTGKGRKGLEKAAPKPQILYGYYLKKHKFQEQYLHGIIREVKEGNFLK